MLKLYRVLRFRPWRLRFRLNPLALAFLATTGCAGPSTPLGAVWAVHPSQVNVPKLSYLASVFERSATGKDATPGEPTVTFYPGRQVLHAPTPLTVVVHEPAGITSSNAAEVMKRLTVRHNGLDVTASFMMQARARLLGDNRLLVRLPKLRLQPGRDHQIEVIYGMPGRAAYNRLEPPACSARADHAIMSTHGFRPNPFVIRQIHELARERGLNPSFVGALIAQESGFDALTISWARALGLTQVTGMAEGELMDKLPEFSAYPRYPGLNEMPYMWVQGLIAMGQINPQNEWRLDTGRSIRGGIAYLELMALRWQTPENRARLLRIFGEDEYADAETKLILASYNSGYSRVWSALNRYENSWQISPDLNEARKYVGRIYSYCDFFDEPEAEIEYENET